MSKADPSRWRTALSHYAQSALVFIVFVGGWELIVDFFDVPVIILPPPSAIALSFWQSLLAGELGWHLAVTMFEVILGFVLGAASGLLLGFGIALSPRAERLFYPYVVAFQTVPKVAVAPIVVIWFGYGVSSKVVITAMIAFFPVLANAIVGLRSAPQDQIDMMLSYTASRWQVFRMVRLPASLPYIFVGLDVAIVLSVIGAIVGEFVGAKEGLGFLILQKNFNFDMAGVFAILLVLSLIGVGLHLLMTTIQRRVLFWANSNQIHVTGL